MTECALERLQLVGDGGLGEAQLPAGLGDAAGAGHDPEVMEVVVVEPFHIFTMKSSDFVFLAVSKLNLGYLV